MQSSTKENQMIIRSYEDALEAIKQKIPANGIEFEAVVVIRDTPVTNIHYPINSSSERMILDQQSRIHFE